MSPRAPLRLLAAAAVAAALSGCSTRGAYPRMPAPETLPAGSPLLSRTLGETDAWLRHYVMEGRADSAALLLEPASRVAPRDELVRRLQLGVVLNAAGRWAESNAAFEWAETEADRRYTRSVSRALGSLAINDGVMEYVPPSAEMALIPYYRMLNYLGLGQRDEAVVEARKTGAWLQRLRDGGREPCVGEGMVAYLAGLVYRAGGERGDALVALRQAERSFDACAGDAGGRPDGFGEDLFRAAHAAGVTEVADSAAKRYGLRGGASRVGAGEVVVLVEHGWVAHRTGRDIHVPIRREEADEVDGDDEESTAEVAARVTARLAGNLLEQSVWGEALDERPENQLADAADGAYVLKLAWPVLRLEALGPGGVRVAAGESFAQAPVVADVSAGLVRHLEARRPAMLTRMVGRGMVKYVATRQIEKKAEKQGGEFAGFLARSVANAAGNVMERADTRCWSLLPDRISVARLVLPAGEHPLRVEVMGPDGAVADTVDLGTVRVVPGETVFVSRRVWGAEMGDLRRLARVGVDAGRAGRADTTAAVAATR